LGNRNRPERYNWVLNPSYFEKWSLNELKSTDAGLVSKQNSASSIPSLPNTYRKHTVTFIYKQLSSRRFNGHLGTYLSKLLAIWLKWAKVNGCKPSFQAKLCLIHCISPQYI
jgi:hypothetical protein